MRRRRLRRGPRGLRYSTPDAASAGDCRLTRASARPDIALSGGSVLRRISTAAFLLALLSAPAALAQPRGVHLVLIPGAGGASPNDFLIRNRAALEGRGFSTSVATTAALAADAARSAAADGRKTVIVGMSAGAPAAAEAATAGAPVAGVVFVSGILMPNPRRPSAQEALPDPRRLPPALVVHNAQDECPLTSPEAARAFVAWTGGRARLRMLNVPGPPAPPCGPMGAHAFVGGEGVAVAAPAEFARSR
jgi:predicted esterase